MRASQSLSVAPAKAALPEPFASWFRARGWRPHAHQLVLLELAGGGRDSLLIAPTGGGKTLAGFLPSLVDLAPRPERRKPERAIHTLYVSPLKALAVDIARNLAAPVEEMNLPIRLETRTGDTPQARRARQRVAPPDILLTTPEQIALMLSHKGAAELFGSLRFVILDELHALAPSKRGDLLVLNLARLRTHAPGLIAIGLSATVARPYELAAVLVPHEGHAATKLAEIVTAGEGVRADIAILKSDAELPWAGHSARNALPEIYDAIKAHRMSLVFVNTRSQAEMLFHALWRYNEDNLPIALHHGSLDVAQRRKVEAAMVAGKLRAVICTSTLDLGIDWGDVDLVINVGAPKGASRLAQRIGRANHRLDEPSKALLVPANRFEVIECQAALEAAEVGAQDTPPMRPGALDVLAQHVLRHGLCRALRPRQALSRGDERSTLSGAIARRLRSGRAIRGDGRLRARQLRALRQAEAHARQALAHRASPHRATIPAQCRHYRRGADAPRAAGAAQRRGAETIEHARAGSPAGRGRGIFHRAAHARRHLRLRRGSAALRGPAGDGRHRQAHAAEPKVPAYEGGKFPLSTYLAERVRKLLAEPYAWPRLPDQVSDWLRLQAEYSVVPGPEEVLVETFPRGQRHYLVCYPFEGRLAHQSLGMLLTRRLERARAAPLGFVANEYALAVWALNDMGEMVRSGRLNLAQLFDEDMLGDDLDAWLAESSVM